MITKGIFSDDLITHQNKILGLMYKSGSGLDEDYDLADFDMFDYSLEINLFSNTSYDREFIILVNYHVFLRNDEDTEDENEIRLEKELPSEEIEINLIEEEYQENDDDDDDYDPEPELGIFLEGTYEIPKHVPKRKINKIIETIAVDNMLQYLRQCYNNVIRNSTTNNSFLPPFDLEKLHIDIKKKSKKS